MANREVKPGALYLYGVSPSARAKSGKAGAGKTKSRKVSSPGIDGVHAVEALACRGFTCWVSAVDQAAFARALQNNMENLEWLALHGVRHQQVVGEVAKRETVIPARFGTLFSSREALLKNVEGRKAALQKVVSRIADADEWGVKVFAEQQPAPEAASRARSGREYLQQKASRLKKRPERDDSELDGLFTALKKVSADSAPTGKVSGAQPDLLWQATFLVRRSRRRQWEKALAEFVERWSGVRRIEVNGPWPPYSFVSDAD
ncbi:MAG TPA: GvpL/GvpF family gas vesicle protein [Candidatus Limnocylindrales bacterium]|nr:GvpL/GvpF family gas vesicle protein [Candidatus Limnocylindrales bacterium]